VCAGEGGPGGERGGGGGGGGDGDDKEAKLNGGYRKQRLLLKPNYLTFTRAHKHISALCLDTYEVILWVTLSPYSVGHLTSSL
jgi:hypothetical protein